MIETWSSYSMADLVMFSAETYLRLFERANAQAWPLYLLLVLVSAWCLIKRCEQQRPMLLALLLALASWAVAIGFLALLYAPINPYARWAAVAFGVQGVLLLVAGLAHRRRAGARGAVPVASWPGSFLVFYGLLLHPLIGWLSGRPPGALELAGIAPDPTALVMLGGILLLMPNYRWWLTLVPFSWCVLSALTQYGLGMAWPFLPLLVAVAGITSALLKPEWKGRLRR